MSKRFIFEIINISRKEQDICILYCKIKKFHIFYKIKNKYDNYMHSKLKKGIICYFIVMLLNIYLLLQINVIGTIFSLIS